MAKDEVRRWIRSVRRSRTPEERRLAEEALAAHAMVFADREPTTVTTFMPLPTEPPADLLNRRLVELGHRVLIPRIVASDLEWTTLDLNAPTRLGPMGVREIRGPAVELDGVTLMFVPALAIDRSGGRLGQGGGFYDRALATIPRYADGGPLLVAVVFGDEFLDGLPTDWHDIRMDAVLTPDGVHEFTTQGDQH